MKLWSNSFMDGEPIPMRYAFGKIDPKTQVTLSDNVNPHLAWGDVPAGTQSFAITCHDYDVPSKGDDVNQAGKQVPASLPRVDFFHWVLVDVPAAKTEIEEGEFCNGVTPRGKAGPMAPGDTRQGVNDYTGWFAADHDMSGDYYGYDGPCPPWNDSIVHHYVFTVYALDVPRAEVDGKFTGGDVRRAIDKHVLGQAAITGTYTLNPALAPRRIAPND
ncbi:YbhB/YbcL family Raf kinase inhibitor-like protein [Pigmentiphaga sp.]|uniref:YbhB/YbcL family Raf kinase inhibitor-like protein n=1 Tax=Pigmentiphaga sp. TaxID=1977564 RepID=UPI00128B7B59|nr:YbhB/YbcL family Raf kinase inhibitor-like protein [Pigmentiphaga sp.]MPS29604.1 YbhB/YbcL family Raf kinase inhibitor-like protein [Alcaligenaceae bacterium SAGV5]MPS50247.1 YbhB/YbcL family Raf kinase inhibitor-like protein [Alcaligenaceae bacterium SAGV3]MPT55229.1 YbhB/YbcL family Raf kinase inhibitor-like protein [Alcaligenaceae bacterium]